MEGKESESIAPDPVILLMVYKHKIGNKPVLIFIAPEWILMHS